jgi:hypothetical protein
MKTPCSSVILSLVLGVTSTTGCGGKSVEGAAGSGGSVAGASGSGGNSGAGGTAGGSGGSGGALPDCEPPSDSTRAALCLTMEPESIRFENESQLDGRGFLIVDVYDTPTPARPGGSAGATPLLRRFYPPGANDGGGPPRPSDQILITEIPKAIRLDNLPPTAYVQAIFADRIDIDAFVSARPTWGAWLGGYDLSGGLSETPPIQAVQIPAGTGRSMRMPMVALRRLRVTLSLASNVTPLDNGDGPAWALAVRTATPRQDEALHGGATLPCASVGAGSNPILEGVLIGSGTFYVAAGVDDYNLGGTVPGGGLLSFNVDGSVFSLPAATRLEVAPNAYTVDHTVPLNFLVPLEAGEIHSPFSCTTADAGTSR